MITNTEHPDRQKREAGVRSMKMRSNNGGFPPAEYWFPLPATLEQLRVAHKYGLATDCAGACIKIDQDNPLQHSTVVLQGQSTNLSNADLWMPWAWRVGFNWGG